MLTSRLLRVAFLISCRSLNFKYHEIEVDLCGSLYFSSSLYCKRRASYNLTKFDSHFQKGIGNFDYFMERHPLSSKTNEILSVIIESLNDSRHGQLRAMYQSGMINHEWSIWVSILQSAFDEVPFEIFCPLFQVSKLYSKPASFRFLSVNSTQAN